MAARLGMGALTFALVDPTEAKQWVDEYYNIIKSDQCVPIDSNQQLTGGQGGIGTPQELREHLRKFKQVGVDQVTFIRQAGMNRHEHICESLKLFATEVMPEFKQREAAQAEQKQAELTPYIEAALGLTQE